MMTSKPDIKFYDTSSLLLGGEDLFYSNELFVISSISLKELENIKTSAVKDEDIKYSARLMLRMLEKYPDNYKVVIHKRDNEKYLSDYFDITDDLRILSDALYCDNKIYVDSTIFVTNDLSLKRIANLFFGDRMIESIIEDQDEYTGYKTIIADDDILSEFYQNMQYNFFNLHIGQYLILKNKDDEVIDLRVWTGQEHRNITTKTFSSKWLGDIKPFQNDVYQKLLFDSLINNKITMVRGRPGGGKSQVSLGFLLYALEKNQIDRIIMFCNPVATKNSARLGFYPGSRNDKLLDSQAGNFLMSKLGGREAVDVLLDKNQLLLLPFSDILGYDTTGMRAGYI